MSATPVRGRLFVSEALTTDPVVPAAVEGDAAAWLAVRVERSDAAGSRFHGVAAPYRPATYSVSALERYLQCPFRFFSERVLKLEEDPEDEATLNAKELGIFVHEVFQKFFEEWNRQGHRAITPENLSQAREIFGDVIEPLLATLPEGEAAVQRTRLLGSAADEGLAEAVFQAEAEWETPVVERLLEHALEGEFEIQGENARRGALRCGERRIASTFSQTRRSASSITSSAARPIGSRRCSCRSTPSARFSTCGKRAARNGSPGRPATSLSARSASSCRCSRAERARTRRLRDAQTRLLDAVDRIERGEFPPTPADTMMCTRCAHAAVCRKDYVGDV